MIIFRRFGDSSKMSGFPGVWANSIVWVTLFFEYGAHPGIRAKIIRACSLKQALIFCMI